VDNPDELKDLPAKQFAQLINEYDTDEVLLNDYPTNVLLK